MLTVRRPYPGESVVRPRSQQRPVGLREKGRLTPSARSWRCITHIPVEGSDVLVAGNFGAPLLDAVTQHQLVGALAVVVHVPNTGRGVTGPARHSHLRQAHLGPSTALGRLGQSTS